MEAALDLIGLWTAILALGASSLLLAPLGISEVMPNGARDPGLVLADAHSNEAMSRFLAAVAAHRHPERETDPPLV